MQNFIISEAMKNRKTHQDAFIGSRVDTSKIPTSWVATFTKSEFLEVLNFSDDSQRHAFCPDYGDAIQDKFSERNEVCVLRFTKRQLVQPGDADYPNKQFFAVYGECKGQYCTARYSFTMKEMPKDNTGAKLFIK